MRFRRARGGGRRLPSTCPLLVPAFRSPQGAGRRPLGSRGFGRPGALDGYRAEVRRRFWRGSAREPRAGVAHLPLRRAPVGPERWPGSTGVGRWRLWGLRCLRKVCRLSTVPFSFCKPLKSNSFSRRSNAFYEVTPVEQDSCK